LQNIKGYGLAKAECSYLSIKKIEITVIKKNFAQPIYTDYAN
jgi:hypothetical protein